MEGDSNVVISWGRGRNEGSWCLAPIIHEMKEILQDLGATLVHIHREQNVLANWGVRIPELYCENVRTILRKAVCS